MTLHVDSEIGRLRRVLVHRPGPEIDWMVPEMMERLLFDDILYGEQARLEHDAFCAVLERAGVQVHDPQNLLAETLQNSELRAELMAALGKHERLDESLVLELEQLPAEKLAAQLVAGRPRRQEKADWRTRSFYRLDPVPNYFFQRDPQVVMGDRALVSAMATQARSREPLLSRTVFEHHPVLAGAADKPVRLEGTGQPWRPKRPTLEGGDLLVASPEVLLVGSSERTNRQGIEALAQHLRTERSTFTDLIVVELPPRRSYMHLDTVFTFIDRHLCLAYMPVLAPDGAEACHVYRVDLRAAELSYTLCESLPKALAGRGIDVELVPCGGSESIIDQHREQWTDGANAFALAPGVIVLYRRNRRTADELSRRGWRVVRGEDVAAGTEPLLDQGPTVVTVADNELSRARGGPRCMTMPLERDSLDG